MRLIARSSHQETGPWFARFLLASVLQRIGEIRHAMRMGTNDALNNVLSTTDRLVDWKKTAPKKSPMLLSRLSTNTKSKIREPVPPHSRPNPVMKSTKRDANRVRPVQRP